MSDWTAADVPDLSGKTVVVTGANSGLGFEATRAFAEKGALGLRRTGTIRPPIELRGA